jgi:hypothetical protein
MAVTISFYNHTRKLFTNGEVDLSSLKFMLRNDTTVFNAAHAVVADLAGAEVSGNGWTAGGEAIGSAAVTTVETNGAMLDGADISVEASGSAITASRGVIVANDFASPLALNVLFFVDFDETKSADAGTPFNVTWNANGIARWLQPA